jgi:hypothetical protein
VDQIRSLKSHCNFGGGGGLMLACAERRRAVIWITASAEKEHENGEQLSGGMQVVRLHPVFSAARFSRPIE